MKELIGKRLTVYCSKTKKPLTSVKVFDVDTTGVEYPIQCTIITPFNADDIMMQVFDNNNGFTHFYQTTKSSLKTVLETLV